VNCEFVPQVMIEFKKDLLSRFDVPGWNRFVEELIDKNILAATWRPGERPPALIAFLDFTGLVMRNRHLDGIHLGIARLDGADFSSSSLRNAKIGCCRGALFTGARLDGADFSLSDVSGADFTDATGLESANFRRTSYFVGNPPVSLPASIIAQCLPDAEPHPTDRGDGSLPRVQSGGGESPLRCVATICVTPIGRL
jgi:hypothetical protein